MSKIRILNDDCCQPFREGSKSLLELRESFFIIEKVSFTISFTQLKPNVTTLGIFFSHSSEIEPTCKIKSAYPKIQISDKAQKIDAVTIYSTDYAIRAPPVITHYY